MTVLVGWRRRGAGAGEEGQLWSKLSRVEQSSLRSPLPKGSTHIMPPCTNAFLVKRADFVSISSILFLLDLRRQAAARPLPSVRNICHKLNINCNSCPDLLPFPLTLVEANCVQANGKLRPGWHALCHCFVSSFHSFPPPCHQANTLITFSQQRRLWETAQTPSLLAAFPSLPVCLCDIFKRPR